MSLVTFYYKHCMEETVVIAFMIILLLLLLFENENRVTSPHLIFSVAH